MGVRIASYGVGGVVIVALSGLLSVAHGATSVGGLEIVFQEKLYPADGGERDSFSSSIDISGNTMVSSSREDDNENGEDSGSAYVLERDPVTGAWIEVAKLLHFDGLEHDYFGESAAIAGDVIAIGTDRRRAVYIYERNQGGPDAWGFTQKLEPSDGGVGIEFGWEVDLSDDAFQLAVAAVGKVGGLPGAIYIFERDEFGLYQEITKIVPSDGVDGDVFGWSLGLRATGGRIVVGAHLKDNRRGGGYIFEQDEFGVWNETAILAAGDSDVGDQFGIAASIWNDTAVLGAAHDSDADVKVGSAYVFELDPVTGGWLETAKLAPFDPGERAFFGRCVSNKDNIVIVAAPGDDDLARVGGATYIYRRDQGGDNAWGFVYKPNGQDSIDQDRYAYSIAMDGDDVAIGSDRDVDESGVTTGSIYTYVIQEQSSLSLVGSCPGSVTVNITQAGANGRVMLAIGDGPGETVVGGAQCPGATLDLANARVFAPVTVNASGGTSFVRTLPAGLCGRSMQVLDLSNCRTSNVATLPVAAPVR